MQSLQHSGLADGAPNVDFLIGPVLQAPSPDLVDHEYISPLTIRFCRRSASLRQTAPKCVDSSVEKPCAKQSYHANIYQTSNFLELRTCHLVIPSSLLTSYQPSQSRLCALTIWIPPHPTPAQHNRHRSPLAMPSQGLQLPCCVSFL